MPARRHLHLLLEIALFMLVLTAGVSMASEADGAMRSFPARGAIALTFDDGPDPRFTPRILDILAENDAKATFFVVGSAAERHPDLIERILAEGHEIAHHTQTHPHVDRLSRKQLAEEIDCCLDTLAEQGIRPEWYRPPRMMLTPEQEALCAQRGMKIALWTRCFERKRFGSPTEMASVLSAETEEGDIVLAHDGLFDRTMTVNALPLYLQSMRARGVEVLTLTELHARAGQR